MRQFAGLLTSVVLCSLLCATAQVVVVQEDPVEGLPPESFAPLSLDPSFSFAETNLTAILDIELFPDGRIAYAGVDKKGGFTMTMGLATESGALPQPNFGGGMLAEARSIAVEPRESIFYGAGIPLNPANMSVYDGPVRKLIGSRDAWVWVLNDGVVGLANKVHVLPDRRVLAAGMLRPARSPEQTNGLLRIELNGTVDTNWVAAGSAGLEVTTFEILADGRILGAYQATNEAGHLQYGFARWESNGARDLSYPNFLAAEPNGRVTALRKAPGTNGLVMAIQSLSEQSRPVSRLVLLNEAGEILENPAADNLSETLIEGTVKALAFESIHAASANNHGYDRIIAGGEFTSVGTNECANLAAITPEGIVAWSFEAANGPDGTVEAVEVQADGKILIGGRFTSVHGVSVKGMARLLGASAQGTKFLYWGDSEFRGFERLGQTELVLRRHGGTNEPLTVSLAVTDSNGQPIDNASSDVNAPTQVVFGTGEDRALVRIGIQNNSFPESRERFAVQAEPEDQSVLTTLSLTELTVLDDETPGTFLPDVFHWERPFARAFAVQHDGKILIAADMQILRLNADGTIDQTFITNGIPALGTTNGIPEFGNMSEIHQIQPQANGKIYVVGRFNTSTSSPDINYVARLNPDGTLDRSFNPKLRSGPTGGFPELAALEVLDDGKVLIWTGFHTGRDFRAAGMYLLSDSGELIRQYDGISPFSDAAHIEHLPTGEVFAYGHFSSRNQLAKYGTNGVLDTNFVVRIEGWINTLNVAGDSLYIGGGLRAVNGTPVSPIAKVDVVTGELDKNWRPQINAEMATVLEITDTHIYIGGMFTAVDGIERLRFARLNLDGSLDETFDPGLGPVQTAWFAHEESDGNVLVGFSGQLFDRMVTAPIVRLESGLGTSEAQPATLEIANDEAGLVVRYSAGTLEESADLEAWNEVDTGGGEYRPAGNETMRFYRVVTP